MVIPQHGIFALGTTEHIFFELSAKAEVTPTEIMRKVTSIPGALTTLGGVNVVIGIRPSLWKKIRPNHAPADAADFSTDITGATDYVMPATQADLFIWIAAANRAGAFDNGVATLQHLQDVAQLDRETLGWGYRDSRDLSGFIDGTENPGLLEAAEDALVAADSPGAGSSILLFQTWEHDSTAWNQMTTHSQEQAVGRTKDDSTELDESHMPESSHVSRTVIEQDGTELKIFRRNVAFGSPADHGTVFVGFSAEQTRMHRMIERMAGVEDGIRDGLTYAMKPTSGAYYVIPALDVLAELASENEENN